MRVSELFGKAGIDYPQSAENIEISEIVTDSRRVCEGCAFICINGLSHDGHEYIGEAISHGARVIVVEQVHDAGVGGAATIIVENTRRAAALLYNVWHGSPAEGMTLVAVTGTNGKTSVSFILKRIFEVAGYRAGLIGTVRCCVGDREVCALGGDPLANMTTPDPAELFALLREMKNMGAQFVFIEATSHALALSKLDALRFDTAVVTNLTRDHLDFHGDMENYLRAKIGVFSLSRRAVINLDCDYASRFIEAAGGCEIYTVSKETDADFVAEDIRLLGSEGSSYRLRRGEESIDMRVRLAGGFAVDNTLLASAVALLYGIPSGSVARAVSEMCGIDGRMERVDIGGDDISVFIDYAHTPDALENLLHSARNMRRVGQRIVLLFGCGGDRDRGKRREMAHIASRLADFVIVTSDNSRSESPERIISDILRGMDKEKEFALIVDRAAAIEYAICNSRAGDMILLAGKGHERYEIDGKGRHPFDEREIAARAYSRLAKMKDREGT